jgi:hypothetical protein
LAESGPGKQTGDGPQVSVEAWQIGVGLASIGGTALGYFWNAAIQKGHREALIVTLAKQREEDKAARLEYERQALNRFMRTFQAIEQLRRMHKTGNGGIEWTDLVGKE